MPSSRGEDWQPLLMYRNSLVQGEGDAPASTSNRAYGSRRGHTREGRAGNSPHSPRETRHHRGAGKISDNFLKKFLVMD